MANMLRNLENIQRTVTRFAPDQVLTNEQLNGVVDVLGDAERSSRTALFGVGIAGGLRVLVADGQLTLTRGAGVTTDGDLLYVTADALYTAFKPYGDGAPSYAPFGPDGSRIEAWELVAADASDAAAQPLTELSGSSATDFAVVLLAENWIKEQDVCTGADCDNMGGQCLDARKLILIPKSAAAAFKESLSTADALARRLPFLVIDRPTLSGVTTVGQLATMYRSLCATLITRIRSSLSALYPVCRPLLADLFASDPAGGWNQRLAQIQTAFAGDATGIQYFYDFLKDVAETYSEIRELLFGDFSVLCPDLTAFPKHLLLGNLVASADRDENRTGFYPSPQLAGAGSNLEHARFVARKLDALIANFAVPSGAQALRITPSRGEDTSLEQRAIPYYYQPASTLPMHRRWSYTLERRGMSTFNYGYHATAFGAEGGAAAPLTTQLGHFDFFRVEGHLGMKIDAAAAALDAEIRNKNLPLAIQPVMLGADRTKVFPWKLPRYTDLHRFHDLMRYSLSEQLDDAADYSGVLTRQLDEALGKHLLTGKQAQDARDAALKTADTIKENAGRASTKLRQPYDAFKQDESWRQDVSAGLLAAGAIKRDTTNIAKTEFPSATDSLLESTSLQWIDWLDIFIQDKGDKETGRLLFSAYLASHPGLEHAGGVARGGTLVLAYDEASSVVVADFALPYLCCAPEADEPPPPPSKPPKLKPGLVFERPVTLFNPIEERVQDDITRFWNVTEPKVREQINLQKDYLQMYKDSVAAVGGIVPKDVVKAQVNDRLLALQLDELDLKSQTRDVMQGMLLDPTVSESEKKRVREDIQHVESEIAKLANDTATRVVSLNLAVEPGGDGLKALTSANRQVAKLQSPNLRESFKQTVGTLQGTTQNAKMKDVLTQLAGGL